MFALLGPFLLLLVAGYGLGLWLKPSAYRWEAVRAAALRYPLRSACVGGVLVLHLSAILFFLVEQRTMAPVRPVSKLQVTRVAVKQPPPPPPKSFPIAAKKPKKPKKPTPKPVAKKDPPKPKKRPKPKKQPKKNKPSPKASVRPKKKENPERQRLLAELRKNLENVAKEPEVQEPVVSSAQPLPRFKVDSPVQPKATSTPIQKLYRDELVRRLQMQLRLPGVGDVRVKLTVARDGSVVGVEILDAESPVNAAYVRDIVPTLSLAAFGDQYVDENTHTFHLTLTNDL